MIYVYSSLLGDVRVGGGRQGSWEGGPRLGVGGGGWQFATIIHDYKFVSFFLYGCNELILLS